MRRGIGSLVLVGLISPGATAAGGVDDARVAVGRVLDDFHAAAAAADETRYFAHFTPDAVFLGTAPAERWTLEQFRAYARPHFAAGRGWSYVATERHVVRADDGRLAWFDETLRSEKYGVLRGTGVLRRTTAGWKIAQYSMTFLVPNELAAEVVALIRGGGAESAGDEP